MDLTEAMALAVRGRQQAPVSLRESGDEPMPESRPARVTRPPTGPPRHRLARDRPVDTPELPTDFRLNEAEWYGHVENVARELAEMGGRPHWYDLDEKERVTWRELASHALVAVARADLWLRQRRLADRLDPLPESDPTDTAEREAVAGLNVKVEAEAAEIRNAQLERLREFADGERAA